MNAARKRYFEYLEKNGKMPKDDEDHVSYDQEMGNAHEYDSSGEPHTEFNFEDEEPMEFNGFGEVENYDNESEGSNYRYEPKEEQNPQVMMNKGGMVKKMSQGGMVNKSNFAKALRKRY